MECIRLGAQAKSQVLFAAQLARDQQGRVRQVQRHPRVHANFLENQIGELLEDLSLGQRFAARKKLEPRQLEDELFARGFLGLPGHQWNPSSSKFRRNRSMHFWRVNPMEPNARPSSAATSA